MTKLSSEAEKKNTKFPDEINIDKVWRCFLTLPCFKDRFINVDIKQDIKSSIIFSEVQEHFAKDNKEYMKNIPKEFQKTFDEIYHKSQATGNLFLHMLAKFQLQDEYITELFEFIESMKKSQFLASSINSLATKLISDIRAKEANQQINNNLLKPKDKKFSKTSGNKYQSSAIIYGEQQQQPEEQQLQTQAPQRQYNKYIRELKNIADMRIKITNKAEEIAKIMKKVPENTEKYKKLKLELAKTTAKIDKLHKRINSGWYSLMTNHSTKLIVIGIIAGVAVSPIILGAAIAVNITGWFMSNNLKKQLDKLNVKLSRISTETEKAKKESDELQKQIEEFVPNINELMAENETNEEELNEINIDKIQEDHVKLNILEYKKIQQQNSAKLNEITAQLGEGSIQVKDNQKQAEKIINDTKDGRAELAKIKKQCNPQSNFKYYIGGAAAGGLLIGVLISISIYVVTFAVLGTAATLLIAKVLGAFDRPANPAVLPKYNNVSSDVARSAKVMMQ